MSGDSQVVLITGASGGLGHVAARSFAKSGYRLALTDQKIERLESLQKSLALPADRCLIHAADITQQAEAKTLCAAIDAAFGRIDAVLSIAGGFRIASLAETSEETWDFLFNLNARTVYNLAVAVVPYLKRQRSGTIINIASRAALHGDANVGAYAASKAAVIRLTESLAAELLDSGVRVNCIMPSIIDTAANRQAMPDADPTKWVTPESIAEVLLFLASPAARDISGASIPIYGRA
jgi:NAD(P)-dependent dehydrogenase (short-subunit alcohol dehydrogenase family)